MLHQVVSLHRVVSYYIIVSSYIIVSCCIIVLWCIIVMKPSQKKQQQWTCTEQLVDLHRTVDHRYTSKHINMDTYLFYQVQSYHKGIK